MEENRWIFIRRKESAVFTISNYVKAKTLEEAYELNQARSSRVMGGMMWMRLGNARIKTLIDLSDLGLDKIEETDNVIRIGAMCTLRQIEPVRGTEKPVRDGVAESVRHIVGVPVPESGYRGRKYIWKVRLLGCAHGVSRHGHICGALQRGNSPAVRLCKSEAGPRIFFFL